jgi:hypothetical protein
MKWVRPSAEALRRAEQQREDPETIVVAGIEFQRRAPELVTELVAARQVPQVVFVTNDINMAYGCQWHELDRVRTFAGPGRIAVPA